MPALLNTRYTRQQDNQQQIQIKTLGVQHNHEKLRLGNKTTNMVYWE